MTSFKRWFGAGAIVLVALALVACPALVPDPVGKITPMTFTVGDGAQTVTDVDDLFTNTDDRSTFVAKSVPETVAKASISGTTLTVTPVAEGKATVTITATLSNGKTATTSFMVTVKAKPVDPTPPVDTHNDGPRMYRDLPDLNDLKVDVTPDPINLSMHFRDDEGDAITYTAVSDDTGVVVPSVSGSTLTIRVVSAPGTTTIHVTATDEHGLSVTESFGVTVINQAPMATDVNAQFSLSMVAPHNMSEVALARHFTDAEKDDLSYSVASVDPAEGVLMATVSGSTLMLTAEGAGEADVTIHATDNMSNGDVANEAASKVFRVVVTAVPNEKPVLTMDIPDQTLNLVVMDMMESATETLDLADYFEDPDGMPKSLMYSDDSDMTMIDGSMLTITADHSDSGMMSTIKVTASDGADSIYDMFKVTVEAPEAPTRGSDIGRHSFGSDDRDPRDIILMDHFNNATGYSASSDDTGVVTAVLSEDQTKVILTPIGGGIAEVTITPMNSGGNGPAQSFTVEVAAAAMAPALKDGMTFPDIMLLTPQNTAGTPEDNPEGSIMKVFDDLNMYFEDPDKTFGSKALTFSTTTTNDKAVTVKEEGTTKNKVTLTAVAAGMATITITATDGDGLSSKPASFKVTVSTDNSPPTAENATATGDEDGAILEVDGDPLSSRIPVGETKKVIDNKAIVNYFDDPDMNRGARGDTLTFTVKYYRWGTGDAASGEIDDVDDIIDSTTNVLHASTDTANYRTPLAEDKAQVSDDLTMTEWSGSHTSKFTLSLTGERSSTASPVGGDAVAIIATDEFGLSAARVFQVRTNQKPKAQGPQDEPKVLSDADTFHDLQVGDTSPTTLALVDKTTATALDGYFSDEDGIEDLFNTGAECRADLSIPLVDEKAPLSALTITRTGDVITLSATPDATVTGTMHADIKCSDGIAFSDSVRIRFTTVASTSGSRQ